MLEPSLLEWLEAHAEALDHAPDDALLTRLGEAGLFGLGVPEALGGRGGRVADAVEAVAALAERSLTAAFVTWSQRTFIDYLLVGNRAAALRERELPALLSGEMAGATGLSNAMKFLSGIEQLQLSCAPTTVRGANWEVTGRLPWITNLRPAGFRVAVMAQNAVSRTPAEPSHLILALPQNAPGLQRSSDLDLMGLRGSWTAALDLSAATVGEEWVLDDDPVRFLAEVRPAFLSLQCALPLGLARRAVATAAGRMGPHNAVLRGEVEALGQQVEDAAQALRRGLEDRAFKANPTSLFRLKIALVELAAQAAHLELLSHGGAAYLRDKAPGFERRWREQAFLPLITPSAVQLRTQLAQAQVQQGGAA